MSKKYFIPVSVFLLALAACSWSPSDKLADRVDNAADQRANALDKQAAALNSKADAIRANGEQRSDASDAANRDVSSMMQAERDRIVANKAPAVR